MNKKKLVVLALVLVMVLSIAAVALVGCNGDDIKGYRQTQGIDIEDALYWSVYNAMLNKNLNSLSASAQLTLDANGSEYVIKMNTTLALDDTSNEANSFALSFVDKSANANIVNIYYNEGYSKINGAQYSSYDSKVFVSFGNGSNAKHYLINAMSVSDTLADVDDSLNLDEAKAINKKVWSGVSGIFNYFSLIKGFADKNDKDSGSSLYVSDDNQSLILRLHFDRILDNLADMLGVIDEYTSDLGLALNSSNIKDVLPGITIDLGFHMSGVTDDLEYDSATLEGIDAKLSVAKKDFRIQRTDNSDFLRINIDKNYNFGIGLDFKFGSKNDIDNYNIAPIGGVQYTNLNAINFEAEGELTLNEAIEASFTMNGEEKTIGVPAGTYSIKFAIDADPTKLIGASFDFKNDLGGSLSSIMKVVDYLNIEITNNDASAADKKGLNVTLSRRAGTLYVTIGDITLLGNLLGNLQLNGVNIDRALELLIPLFSSNEDTDTDEGNNGSGEVGSGEVGSGEAGSGETGSGETPSGNNDAAKAKMLAEIAKLVNNMTLLVNCNGNYVDVNVTDHPVNSNEYGILEQTGVDEKGNPVYTEVLGEDGKQVTKNLGDTKLSVSAVANSNGITIDAVIKNLVTYVDRTNKETTNDKTGNLAAKVEVNGNGITITAKSADSLTGTAQPLYLGDNGEIAMTIDLVLKLTSVSYGTANR